MNAFGVVVPYLGSLRGPKCETLGALYKFAKRAVAATGASTTTILTLQQWIPLNPALQFRCFVKGRSLIGVSQFNADTYYEFLSPLQDPIMYEVDEFFENHLQNSFPDHNFVFDVYVPYPFDRVWLLDVHKFAPSTDPILFKWNELRAIENVPGSEVDYEFRLVE